MKSPINPCPESDCSWTSRKDLVRLEDEEDDPMTTSSRPSQPASNGRLSSIISKITSPFSPKTRSFSDFYITTADDPRPTYAPGDNVKGWVNLVITKPTRVTHITVGFHGFVKVYKNAAAPGDGNPVDSPFLKGAAGYGAGSVVMFENESVVCGDGRLEPGRYRFGFDFKFSPGPLPSSLDFERGTIYYAVSAILTRPTTIAPTVMCEKKVELIETIDIANAPLCDPKYRAVSLKPVAKKKNKTSKPVQSEPRPSSIATSQTAPPQAAASQRPQSSNADLPLPTSPSVSEFSTQSGVTSSNESAPMQVVTVDTMDGSQGRNSLGNNTTDESKIITAKVELLRQGYLPGDTIPIRILVKHTKFIQNMRGIIVTLYRRARVDARPDRGPTKARKGEYTKSRTAFGGLTFAPPRPDHTFRMDLCQNFAPLITNPNTLTAEVKTYVTVPEDAFPTIANVPDDMIRFTYHLEVIMDLNCKLSGIDRILPKMSITNDPSNPTLGQAASQAHGTHGHVNQFLDTTLIRRKEAIPDCLFDITIGTRDGARKPATRHLDPWDEAERQARVTRLQDPSLDIDSQSLPPPESPPPIPYTETPRPPPVLPVAFNPPPPEPEEPVDEKTRLRRAEERLLPSAPPEDFASSSHKSPPLVPSAPNMDDFDDQSYHVNAPAYSGASAPSLAAINGNTPHPDTTAGPSSHRPAQASHVDDKQELERQGLLATASAPDYRNDDDSDPVPNAPPVAPSAPTLDEDAEYHRLQRAHTGEASLWNGHGPNGLPASENPTSNGHRARVAEGRRGAHDAFEDHDDAGELPTYQR